jgi:prolyl-tRNA synthetase
MRPRFGLVRSREFLMKDAYSFDVDEAGLELSYQKMLAAYHRIFKRLGIKYKVTGADSGAMGGKFSEEFVAEGACPELEIGHIFKLGTPYSEKMKGLFLDKTGRQQLYVMGCYGIGVSRLVSAVIENNYDQSGIIWPLSVAPFHLLILPVNYADPTVKEVADRLYAEVQEKGIPVLMDDRPRSAGEKFKDADLVGIPFRITVGKNLKEGKVELKKRADPEGELFSPDQILETFFQRMQNT